MKTLSVLLLALLSFAGSHPAFADETADSRRANTVILTAEGVKNLRIETVTVEETDFEQTVFAIGRIEAKPGTIASVSSRVPGRVVELQANPGDSVSAGQVVTRLETRQAGNPPPVVNLSSPIAGTVTTVDVRLGDPVEPDKPVLTVTDLREMVAVARVPEHLAGQLRIGATAQIRVAALSSQRFEGRLLRFGTEANTETGTIDAIFSLPNPEGTLRPGLRAEFSIVIGKRAGVLSIPRSALQGDAGNRFVYVKDFDLPNAFVKTPVVVGEINDRTVEVLSGLFPADDVVTQGAYSLAFAGGGSVSLKEALDAAHGHEHNADGSEIDSTKKPSPTASGAAATSESPFWKISTVVLFVLLVVSVFRRKGSDRA